MVLSELVMVGTAPSGITISQLPNLIERNNVSAQNVACTYKEASSTSATAHAAHFWVILTYFDCMVECQHLKSSNISK